MELFIAILALLVAIYSAYLQRKAVLLMVPKRRGTAVLPPPIWWKSPSIMALILLVVLAWTPWAIDTWKNWGIQKAAVGVASWGAATPDLKTLQIIAVSAESRPDEKLIAVAMHYKGGTDILDWSPLEASAQYDFRIGAQPLYIVLSDAFLNEIQSGSKNTQYFLLVVPKNIKKEQFKTLREAIGLGAKLVWSGVGPP